MSYTYLIGWSEHNKWYHDQINGKESYFIENTQPDNWGLGRLKRKGY